MTLSICAVVAAAGCFPDMVVSNHYGTLDDARENTLFVRGWLPDILPASAKNIQTTNDLDLNTSSGSFSFDPANAQHFYERLSTGAPEQAPFRRWQAQRDDYAREGFSTWTYHQDERTWVFFCKEQAGECEYVMWSGRGRPH